MRLHLGSTPKRRSALFAACLVSIAVLVLSLRSPLQPAPLVPPGYDPNDPTVGTSASINIVLDRPDYLPTPQDYSAPMWVRIDQIDQRDDGKFLYRISYTGLESGVFNITDYLQKSPTTRLSDPIVAVGVRSVIPKRALSDFGETRGVAPRKAFPYQRLLGLLCAIWLVWGLWLLKRRISSAPKLSAEEDVTPLTDTNAAIQPQKQQRLSDVLRPFVEKAALKTISTKEKALMERILLLFWGQKLELDHLNDAEQFRRILADEEAGALLHTIEQWLYQPASDISAETIQETLEPYVEEYMENFPVLKEVATKAAQIEKRLLAHA